MIGGKPPNAQLKSYLINQSGLKYIGEGFCQLTGEFCEGLRVIVHMTDQIVSSISSIKHTQYI